MSKTKKAMFSILFVVAILFSFVTNVSAATHTQTITIDNGQVITEGMTFEGNNVVLYTEGTAIGVIEPESSSHRYQVRLEKKTFWGWTEFTTANLLNNGPSSMEWVNTGSGTFRFVFSRPRYDFGKVILNMIAYDA